MKRNRNTEAEAESKQKQQYALFTRSTMTSISEFSWNFELAESQQQFGYPLNSKDSLRHKIYTEKTIFQCINADNEIMKIPNDDPSLYHQMTLHALDTINFSLCRMRLSKFNWKFCKAYDCIAYQIIEISRTVSLII